jgi:glycolate oxidase
MEAQADLIERARLVCGSEHLLTDPVTLSTYRSDGVRRQGPLPLAVALPAEAGEVAALVSACHATAVPWVVRGAGTSRDGGALPLPGGLMIVLTRMRRIRPIDLSEDELTVEPGVPAAAIARAVAPSHQLNIDHPGTVGGATAIGAIGPHLVGLDLVRDDGALVSLSVRSAGYDVVGAFGGTHGTRGIAVSITLRAVPVRD